MLEVSWGDIGTTMCPCTTSEQAGHGASHHFLNRTDIHVWTPIDAHQNGSLVRGEMVLCNGLVHGHQLGAIGEGGLDLDFGNHLCDPIHLVSAG